MIGPESIALIQRAKGGDREAWDAICKRYYPRWLRQFHGQIGDGLRNLNDTEDLIQSAVTEALRCIKDLRSEAAFFSWVSAIARRKMAEKRRQERKIRAVPLDEDVETIWNGPLPGTSTITEEEYLRLLDSIISLFDHYPEPMAAVYMKYFERADSAGLMKAMGRAERSVHRLVRTGLMLIRSRLGDAPGEEVL